jgi:mannose-1-phosphate guanylyltransferase
MSGCNVFAKTFRAVFGELQGDGEVKMDGLSRKQRWGLILAGGDGVRLRPLTRFICHDERPKQFCPLYGGTTPLEQARRRAQRTIRPGQILFSLNREHEQFYLHSLVDCPSQRIVQPRNCGTAPAILTSLRLIADTNPEASVAVLPSDHYFSDERRFAQALDNAFVLSHRFSDSVVLIGAIPDRPETEYGWIEPGAAVDAKAATFLVRGFDEKPREPAAQMLMERGCLWNTFVMVGHIRAFLELIGLAVPGLLKRFRNWRLRRAPGEEVRIGEWAYDALPNLDFSQQILSAGTERLMVHRLDEVQWNDLGDCARAVAALSFLRKKPAWVGPWCDAARGACA